MKKYLSILLSLIMILSAFSAFADGGISLSVNGKIIDTGAVSPEIKDGRTMVPFRPIFEALNAKVEWSQATKKAYAIIGTTTVMLTIDSTMMIVTKIDDSGNASTVFKTLDSNEKPYISNSSTFVPVRAICDAIGASVAWDDNAKCVVIKTADYKGEPTDSNTGDNNKTDTDKKPESDGNKNNDANTGTSTGSDSTYTPTIDDNPAYYTKPETAEDKAKAVAELINKERTASGLSELIYDDNIAYLAYMHSEDMAENGFLDHTSSEGLTLDQRVENFGIPFTSIAENIGSGFSSASEVVKSWLNSQLHCDNIMNPEFTRIGVGYYEGGDNGNYWTLILISD